MKILAIAATNHKESINKKLLNFTASIIYEQATQDINIEILDLIDYELPLYRQDRQANSGIPAKAQEFYEKIGNCDAVLLSFAEHNGSFSAVYKNLFDWMSRINQKVYQHKPVIIMAASPGQRGGAGVLGAAEMGDPHFGMDIKAKVSVPHFRDNFDFETGEITNEDIKQQITTSIASIL